MQLKLWQKSSKRKDRTMHKQVCKIVKCSNQGGDQ
jgi:hypothetical protein